MEVCKYVIYFKNVYSKDYLNNKNIFFGVLLRYKDNLYCRKK